ncbi:MAG: alkyl hydroperoxide reductase subunit F [Desulfobacterales bacterium]|nr:MAG: alkyl hydroperoxide reductase subunit F [Desulfobacterales bacterium]
MLEPQISEQLKTVFEALEGRVELSVDDSSHEKQGELLEMLDQVAMTSENIIVTNSGRTSEAPRVAVRHDKTGCGISFSGIPGGHEFSSLVLAILNADGKGRLPDEVLVGRIRRLKGPVHLRTYVSLSCENCPEVVQTLNLVAIFNPDFTHEMIDGAFFQDEITALGIQGVPSVMHDDVLISSGKADLVQLLSVLEERFGAEAPEKTETDAGRFDVAVIGGGPAGVAAAVYAARKGLKTLMVAEKAGGQVKDTLGIENLISVPYTEGPKLADKLYQHVSAYDIKVLSHRRITKIENGDVKILKADSGEFARARAVIIATGARWRTLNIPGEAAYTGRGVAFCPHCDGPFYKGRDVAVIGGGNSGIEAAIDLAGIVRSVAVFEFLPELKADQVLVEKALALPNVTVRTNTQTLEVLGDDKKVTGLRYKDRDTEKTGDVNLDGIFVQIGLAPNSGFISDLVEINRFGEIMVDEKCRTSVPGIYAAGDVTTVPYKQIIISMGEGAKAALAAFEDLVLKGI